MIRRFSIYALIVLSISLVAAYVFVPPITIEIQKSQLDREIAERLPYEVDRLIGTVTVNEATVQLGADGKMALQAEFEAKGVTLEGTGTATVLSSVRYGRGKFYLSDLTRDNIEFTLSENSNKNIAETRSFIDNVLNREIEEAEAGDDVGRIADLNAKDSYLKTGLEQDALNVLDEFIANFPVYDLNQSGDGLAYIAMAMAMDDVEIAEDKIVATLSLQTFFKRLAVAVLPGLIILMIGFARIRRLFRAITQRG